MQFNSFHFLCFFPLVIAIYFIIPKKTRYIWLLICSYYFYMGWNPKYAILIAISTLITYLSGIGIQRAEKIQNINTSRTCKKWIVAGSFIVNLTILVFFKYFDFILANVNILLSKVGIGIINKSFDVLLPVGISFYTFQALSYTVDVYRGDVKAEKNIFKYALFVSFFPQLVAGPIERSKNLLTQVECVDKFNLWNYDRVTKGLTLMLWGFFQKMVIADRVAILVDTVYDRYWLYGSTALIIATLLFGIQIYCDFASYSNIAIGAAEVMGFSLMENFNTPYFSLNVKEFWRRWHISLSTWFRDYLYIPLGGSKKGKIRKYVNTMIVFLVSGLWHGASWNFVAWGGLHGLYQVMSDITYSFREKIKNRFCVKTESFSYKLGQVLITFALVDFAWLFFRANSFKNSIEIIYRILTHSDLWTLFDGTVYTWGLDQKEFKIVFFGLLILLLVDLIRRFWKKRIDIFLSEQCLWFRWTVLLLLLFSCVIFGIYGQGYDASQFIYFQF